MRYKISFVLILLCTISIQAQNDNQELADLFNQDQKERLSGPIDAKVLNKNDSIRRNKVREFLSQGKIQTANDYYHAAMVFQHGWDTISSGMAIKMMKMAVKKDSTINKWLLAAAIDRDLMRKHKPQIYGTQYILTPDQKFELYTIDTTKISDKVREKYNVKTIAEQKEEVIRLNQKRLGPLLAQKSAKEFLSFLTNEFSKERSDYDLSERVVNNIGYYFLEKGKLDTALKVLKLNTKKYPESANTWDSYGEALFKNGKREQAMKSYKMSLKLNPDNENAKMMIKKIMSKN